MCGLYFIHSMVHTKILGHVWIILYSLNGAHQDTQTCADYTLFTQWCTPRYSDMCGLYFIHSTVHTKILRHVRIILYSLNGAHQDTRTCVDYTLFTQRCTPRYSDMCGLYFIHSMVHTKILRHVWIILYSLNGAHQDTQTCADYTLFTQWCTPRYSDMCGLYFIH